MVSVASVVTDSYLLNMPFNGLHLLSNIKAISMVLDCDKYQDSATGTKEMRMSLHNKKLRSVKSLSSLYLILECIHGDAPSLPVILQQFSIIVSELFYC